MPRKTRIRKTKRRKGSGPVSQFMRNRLGVSMYASTKDAATEIKNIYANLTEDEIREKDKPVKSYDHKIQAILGRNFGPSFLSSNQRIIKELEKFMVPGGPDVSPKNLYRAIREIRERK